MNNVRILFYPLTPTQEMFSTTSDSCNDNEAPLTAAACFNLDECLPYLDPLNNNPVFLKFSIDESSLSVSEYEHDCVTTTGNDLKFVEYSSHRNSSSFLHESVCGLPAIVQDGSLSPLYSAHTRAKWQLESCNPIPSIIQESSYPAKLPSAVSELLQKSREVKSMESSDNTYYLHEYVGSSTCSDLEAPFWAKECIPNNICLPFKDNTSIKIMATKSGLQVGVFFMGGCNSFLQVASVNFGTSTGIIAQEDQCASTVLLDSAIQQLPYNEAVSIRYSIVNCPVIFPSTIGAQMPASINNLLAAAHVASMARLYYIVIVAVISLSIGALLSLCYARKRRLGTNDYSIVSRYQIQRHDSMELPSASKLQESVFHPPTTICVLSAK